VGVTVCFGDVTGTVRVAVLVAEVVVVVIIMVLWAGMNSLRAHIWMSLKLTPYSDKIVDRRDGEES